ncbi:MAG: hypothetical protein QNJ20_04905 [Paracoccaceae bacterium]|nr:hypothetical protein [Paracoccaceae bacterium]
MLKIAFCAAYVSFSAGWAMAQDTVTWEEDIEGWNVAIDRTIDNSCFIISGFENDIYLRVQFNATQQNVQFIVANMGWESLETGQTYGMEVAFGDQNPWEGLAEGHVWNGILPSLVLSVPFADQQASHFMREFADMGSVRISHEGAELAHLILSGAEEAVASMLACQRRVAEAEDSAKAEEILRDKDAI